jgi:heme exporter protein D
MDLGPHAAFILAAYAVTIGVTVALTAWVVADYRTQRRTLSGLEQRGLARRSASKPRQGAEPVRSEAT